MFTDGDQLIVLLNALSQIPPSIRQDVVDEVLTRLYAENDGMDVYERRRKLVKVFTRKVN